MVSQWLPFAVEYTPLPLRNAPMFARLPGPRLDSQLHLTPGKQMTRKTAQSCFDFCHCGCSGALINSNWIELVEDSVCANTHTHAHTQRQTHTYCQRVFVFFGLLLAKFRDYRSEHQQM